MIKAVIFDMDGVIIDSEPIWAKMEEIFLGKRGYHPERKYQLWAKGRKDKEAMFYLRKKYQLEGTTKKLLAERIKIVISLMKKLRLIPYFLPLIKRLSKNYKIILASSSPKKAVFWVVRNFGLKKYFDLVISGSEVKKAKPRPDIFLRAAKKLKVRPSECVVIEDTLNGVVAAKRAGMKCVALKQPYMRYQDLKRADIIVKSLKKIDLNLINKL